jgi:hypothetical protein
LTAVVKRRKKGSKPIVKLKALRELLNVLPVDGVISYLDAEQAMFSAGASLSYVRLLFHELVLSGIAHQVRPGWYLIDREKLARYIERIEGEFE